jgi:hypothetical protein
MAAEVSLPLLLLLSHQSQWTHSVAAPILLNILVNLSQDRVVLQLSM